MDCNCDKEIEEFVGMMKTLSSELREIENKHEQKRRKSC